MSNISVLDAKYDWDWLHLTLRDLEMRKADLARHLGICGESVSRWRHKGIPGYAVAYLRLRLRYRNADALIRSYQRQIQSVHDALE